MNNIDIGRCKRIVQYLWDPEPRNDEEPDKPIWCLGRKYDTQSSDTNGDNEYTILNTRGSIDATVSAPNTDGKSSAQIQPDAPTQEKSEHGWPTAFLDDFESKAWMTYRSSFTPIPRIDNHDGNSSMTLSVRLRSQLMDTEGFTSDTGWGCMIRSGQSLLANTLSILILGRDWRRSDSTSEMQLLSLFADSPEAPFSIHRFVKHGAECCSKYPGEWFGPSATAKCIEALSRECQSPRLRVYVTSDTSDVYEDKFVKVASDETGSINPTLILLGIRLGIDHITPVYWDGLKATLQYPQSIGIAGGRPSASHYFVGVQGSYLFYLDPHHTRPAVQSARDKMKPEDLDTYHTRRLRRIHIKDMDPSMLIGFLIRDEADWTDWKRRVETAQGKAVVHVFKETPDHGRGREEALDEVEALDDTDGDGLE